MFRGKYIKRKNKKTNKDQDEEDDVKIGENHDWKETPVYK